MHVYWTFGPFTYIGTKYWNQKRVTSTTESTDLHVLLEALLLPLLEGGRRALEYGREQVVHRPREEVVPLPARARREEGHEETNRHLHVCQCALAPAAAREGEREAA